MAIETASDWRIFIGTTAPATTQSEFEADTYIEIEEVESLGEFGDESADVTFTALKDGRTRHLKGPRDAGTKELVVGRDPLDPGQNALIAAEATKFEYNFKVIAADAASELYTDSVFYYRAKVMSGRVNAGAADNVVRRNFNLGIQTKPLEIPSALA
jgi:hypothetical protein